MVGLCIVSLPVSRLAFEYGRVHPDAARYIAEAACLYSLGLFAYAAVKVLAPAYYALHRTRRPVLAALGAMAVNVLLNTLLFLFVGDPRYRFWGLALASSLGAFVNFTLLASGFKASKVELEWGRMAAEWARIGLAVLALAAVAGGSLFILGRLHLPLARVFEAVIPAILGAAVYFWACRSLHCRSFAWVFSRGKKGTG
jgi:putative peptidoglycan lipid II flippase